MAGGLDLGTSQRGGKKPLDTAINLVPFIDLMACTIAFLIMTAVWTQTGRLEIAEGGAGPSTTDAAAPFVVVLTPSELTVGSDKIPVQRNQGRLDITKLSERLRVVDRTSPITIRAADDVAYDDLVRVVDACAGAKLQPVTVEPIGG